MDKLSAPPTLLARTSSASGLRARGNEERRAGCRHRHGGLRAGRAHRVRVRVRVGGPPTPTPVLLPAPLIRTLTQSASPAGTAHFRGAAFQGPDPHGRHRASQTHGARLFSRLGPPSPQTGQWTMTTANATRAARHTLIKIIPFFCQIG